MSIFQEDFADRAAHVAGVPSCSGQRHLFAHRFEIPNQLEKEEPWVNIIKTRAEWQAFYDELTTGLQGESNTLSEIDFEVFQLIVGGIGVRGAGR